MQELRANGALAQSLRKGTCSAGGGGMVRGLLSP